MKRLAGYLLSLAVVCPLLIGCPEHRRGAVVYGTWAPGETVYYSQWETERHYDHRDYERRERREQQEYWKWRKHHHEHDHDH